MNAQHTPGPWRVGGGLMKPHHERCVIRDARGWYLARVDATSGREQQDANARLMAAAPDLLETLREAWIALPGNRHNADLNARMKALLARIDGEETR